MSDTRLNGLPAHEGRMFLLVEDDPEDAFLVELEFKRSQDCRLCIVRDGQQAIDYLKGQPPYDDRHEYPLPDVILLDLKMPRLDGFDVLSWLRNESEEDVALTPVIVMSSANSVEDVQRAYKLGANLFMNKPVDWEQFRERLRLLGTFWCEYAGTFKRTSERLEPVG
jgi:two-component system response regulator